MIDNRPALIARCIGVADVMDAVNFARTQNLLISVREEVTTSPATRSAMAA